VSGVSFLGYPQNFSLGRLRRRSHVIPVTTNGPLESRGVLWRPLAPSGVPRRPLAPPNGPLKSSIATPTKHVLEISAGQIIFYIYIYIYTCVYTYFWALFVGSCKSFMEHEALQAAMLGQNTRMVVFQKGLRSLRTKTETNSKV